MRIVLQAGNIITNPPKQVDGVDYAVITTDSNVVCCVIKTLDAKRVIVIYPEDENFDDTITLLGLDKNETVPDLLKV